MKNLNYMIYSIKQSGYKLTKKRTSGERAQLVKETLKELGLI